MKKKQLNEFIPLLIFLISGTCALFKVRYAPWANFLSGFWLGGLYFYFAFWLYSDYAIPLVTRIIVGVLFSLNIIACMFCFLNWPWKYYSIANFCGLGILTIIGLFNHKSIAYKPLFYRSVFFIVLFCLIYGYKRFSS
jgi:hypothetical protein